MVTPDGCSGAVDANWVALRILKKAAPTGPERLVGV